MPEHLIGMSPAWCHLEAVDLGSHEVAIEIAIL